MKNKRRTENCNDLWCRTRTDRSTSLVSYTSVRNS